MGVSSNFCVFSCTIFLLGHFGLGYMLTTPSYIYKDGTNRICMTLSSPATSEDHLEVMVKTNSKNTPFLIPRRNFPLVEGEVFSCVNLAFENVHDDFFVDYNLIIEGILDGVNQTYSRKFSNLVSFFRTIIESDRKIYRPQEIVNFRVTTLGGAFLNISTQQYQEIWIENGFGQRMTQWLNVSNENGLLHRSFKLPENSRRGTYHINVRSQNKDIWNQKFEVKKPDLQTFEITINSSHKYSENISKCGDYIEVEVCAKYKSGFRFNGLLNLTAENVRFPRRNVTKPKMILHNVPIFGCRTPLVFDPCQLSLFIILKATVREMETGVEIEEVARIRRQFAKMILFRLIRPNTKKPGLPQLVKMVTEFTNGILVLNETFEVCGKQVCRNFTSNSKGILEFVIPHGIHKNSIKVRAFDAAKSKLHSPIPSRIIYSPTNSSLDIDMDNNYLIKCNSTSERLNIDIPVRFSAFNMSKAQINVQLLAWNQILFSKSFEQIFGEKDSLIVDKSLLIGDLPHQEREGLVRGMFVVPISIPKTADRIPTVLIWYVREDGEVVAEKRILKTEICLQNQVNLKWGLDASLPGVSTSLSISAAPHSLCSLKVQKKLPKNSFYNSFIVGSVIYPRNPYVHHPVKQCEYKSSVADKLKKKFMPHFVKKPSYNEDVIDIFEDVNLQMYFNQELMNCTTKRWYTRIRRMVDDNDSKESPDVDGGSLVWDLVRIPANGVLEKQINLPETQAEVFGTAFCVNPSKGVGYSDEATIRIFKEFFIDFAFPSSAKKGEVLPVTLFVHSSLEKPFPIRIAWKRSPDYEIVPNSTISDATEEQSVCISPGDNEIPSMSSIRLTTIGIIYISVHAVVDTSQPNCEYVTGTQNQTKDVITRKIKVEFDGLPREKMKSMYICAKGENRKFTQSMRDVISTEIVPETARGRILISGEIFSYSPKDLKPLINEVKGNFLSKRMKKFSQNVFVLEYLIASKKTNLQDIFETKKYLREGLQLLLAERHEDGLIGEYFRRRFSDGSVRASVPFLKYLAHVKKHIFVNNTDIDMIKNGLAKHQQEDGCFKNTRASPPLGIKITEASMFLQSLIEVGEEINSPLVQKVLHCVKAVGISENSYVFSLAAYAIALAESSDAQIITDLLLSRSKESNGMIYWEIDVGKIFRKSFSAESDFKRRENEQKKKDLEMETAGYAILTLLKLVKKYPQKNYESKIAKIIKWLKTKRLETRIIGKQRTLVVLHALAEFERWLPQGPTNLTVVVQSGDAEFNFHYEDSNRKLQERVDISSLPLNVSFNLNGRGCVFVETYAQYNIPHPEASKTFKLNILVLNIPHMSCKTKMMSVCVSNINEQISDLKVIEIELVDGYAAVKEDLEKIDESFEKQEVEGNILRFYKQVIGTREVCTSFKILQKNETTTNQGYVKVYYKNKQENFIYEEYAVPNTEGCLVN